MCEKRLISTFDLKDGITSGLVQANPQNEIDARLKQITYDSEDSNDDPKVKDTCFLFIMEDTEEPVAGLKIIIESKDSVKTYKTNRKGFITVPFDREAPYRLLNVLHPDYTGSKQLDAADVMIDFTYENCLSFAGKEKKDLSYIKSWKKTSETNTKDSYMPMKQLKINSGDTLSNIIKKEYPLLKTLKNRADFIYYFNWNKAVKETYYWFDFGKQNQLHLPLFMDAHDGFEKNKTHIIRLKKEKKTEPCAMNVLLSDLNVVCRLNWSKVALNKYNILDPRIFESKRTPLRFDCEYDTIVVFDSGNIFEPTIEAHEDYHISQQYYEDIGYHFIIGRADKQQGKIYEGRPLIFRGAAAGTSNSKTIAILVAGDFVDQWYDDDDELEVRQLELLERLVIKLKKEIPTIKSLKGRKDLWGHDPSDNNLGRLHNSLGKIRGKAGL